MDAETLDRLKKYQNYLSKKIKHYENFSSVAAIEDVEIRILTLRRAKSRLESLFPEVRLNSTFQPAEGKWEHP